MPMSRAWRAAVLLVAVVATLTVPPIAGAAEPAGNPYRRAYLLADSGERLWWSFDAHEPDADLRLVSRRCPDYVRVPGTAACRGAVTPAGHAMTLWFHPRGRLTAPAEWTTSSPARLRLALEVDTPLPYHVELAWDDGGGLVIVPATQVEPGVWEAAVTGRTLVPPGAYLSLGVRLRFDGAGGGTMRLRTDGSSYLEFPSEVRGWSWSDLQARSPAPTVATSYASELRSFRFNDDQWEAFAFEGDLSAVRRFTVDLQRRAEWAIGWAETYREPWIQDAVRRGRVDQKRLTDTPRTWLYLNDEAVATGMNLEDEQTGRGTDVATAMDLEPGSLALEVTPSDYSQGATYRAYILVGYGARTLAGMRSSFQPNQWFFLPNANAAGVVAVCPGNAETVPLTAAATAVQVDLDWDSINPTSRWSPSYQLPHSGGQVPCGWDGLGDDVTLLASGAVFRYGATPSYDSNTVVFRDTVIDSEVNIIYEP